MLEAYIIDKIKRREEEAGRREYQQPGIQPPLDDLSQEQEEEKRKKDKEKTPVIIDLLN